MALFHNLHITSHECMVWTWICTGGWQTMLVTSILAAVAALALVGLSAAVSQRRSNVGIDVGHGDDDALFRRIRAQGNFIEYVPLALIVIGLGEYGGVAAGWLWGLAALLVVGRACHAAGMYLRNTPLRAVGMLATHGCLLLGAVVLIASGLPSVP